jgi:hypothetical protein
MATRHSCLHAAKRRNANGAYTKKEAARNTAEIRYRRFYSPFFKNLFHLPANDHGSPYACSRRNHSGILNLFFLFRQIVASKKSRTRDCSVNCVSAPLNSLRRWNHRLLPEGKRTGRNPLLEPSVGSSLLSKSRSRSPSSTAHCTSSRFKPGQLPKRSLSTIPLFEFAFASPSGQKITATMNTAHLAITSGSYCTA